MGVFGWNVVGCWLSTYWGNVWVEGQILEVRRHTTISTKCLAAHTLAFSSVHCTLQEQQLYPYHVQSVQELVPYDAPAKTCILSVDFLSLDRRRAFSKGLIHRWIILGSPAFTRDVWSVENDFISPSAATGFLQLLSWTFRWLPHMTSYFTGMCWWPWLP
jgi:hypothetical protein